MPVHTVGVMKAWQPAGPDIRQLRFLHKPQVHQKQGEELHNIVSAMTQASLGKPEALQRLAVNPPSALLDRMLPAESNQGTASRRELDRLASRVSIL